MIREPLKELKSLISRLEASSPFYQKKFKECGVEAGDIKNMEDFRKLPFLSLIHI